MSAPHVTPALLVHWGVHAALAGSYVGFRRAHGGAPATVRSPSYLIGLGLVPADWTQEVDILLFTLLLAGQKYRRSTNVNEFLSTALWYLQLAVGALLALTAARPCAAYAGLLLAGWALAPPPPLPLARLGFHALTPYELAVMASRRVRAAGSFAAASGGGAKRDAAIVVAAAHRHDEAALSAREVRARGCLSGAGRLFSRERRARAGGTRGMACWRRRRARTAVRGAPAGCAPRG